MSFLFPQFLFGLLALAIPIIIHLFNFRKVKKVFFSNTQFLKNVKEVSTSKLKLKHLLILTARLLFIIFLVLAFAQPFIPSENEALQSDNVFIYLDNSQSMSNKVTTDLTAHEQSIDFISELINVYPQNTKYQLLTNDYAPWSNTQKSRSEVGNLLSEIKLSSISRSLEEINNRQFNNPFQTINDKVAVYWLSDFQKSTAGNFDKIQFDSSAKYNLVPLNYSSSKNIFVDSLYMANPFLLENEKNELVVRFGNTSDDIKEDLPVKLFINNTQVANTSISIAPGDKTTATFELNHFNAKINKCIIKIEEFPVTFDNDFYFTLNIDDKVNIMEIKSAESSDYVKKVYTNKGLFSLESYLSDNVDYHKIESADLIIINEVSALSSSLIKALNNFLADGGTIMLIPSENINVNAYQQLVHIQKKVSSTLEKIALKSPDFSNPFFNNMFVQSDEIIEMPLATNFISPASVHQKILTLKNRTPFLSKMTARKKIFLFSTPFKETFTNFQKHAVFVPIMYRIAAQSNVMNDKLYHTVHESLITLKVDSIIKNDIYKLKKEAAEIIPSQRIIGNELMVEIPKHTISQGFYDLSNTAGIQKVLAFNLDKKESKMQQYKTDDLSVIFKSKSNVKVYNNDSTDFTTSLKAQKSGTPLWKYMLILSLLALLAEILLIRLL